MLVLVFVGLSTVPGDADVVGSDSGTIVFHGSVFPRSLPRNRQVPISLQISARVRTRHGHRPPDLRRIDITLNPHAVLQIAGLPRCPARSLRSVTTRRALALCRDALLGTGNFRARIRIPEGAPFPSYGRLLLFASGSMRHPRLIGHVFGTHPAPTAHLLAIRFRPAHAGSGASLSADLPAIHSDWGHVSGFDLDLHRTYRYRGRSHSFISSSCPAPDGFTSAPFIAARGRYTFAGGHVVIRLLTRSCRVAPG